MKIRQKAKTRAESRKNHRDFMSRIRDRTSKGAKMKPKIPDTSSIHSTVIRADKSHITAPAGAVMKFYKTSYNFRKKKFKKGSYSTPYKCLNLKNTSYNYSTTSTKRSLRGESSSPKISVNQSREISSIKTKSVMSTREKARDSIQKLLIPTKMLDQNLTVENNEIMDSKDFSYQLENIFVDHKINDYKRFDYRAHCDQNYSLKSYFGGEYNKEEVDGLLKIHTVYEYSPGHILKEKNMPFVPVVLIISGKVGVYHYPQGKKTLFRVLKSKDVVGDYELNFVTTRTSQYEVLTKVKLLKFPKDEYERVTFERENKLRQQKIHYLKTHFPFFKEMEEEKLHRLSKKVKQKKMKYNDVLILKGTAPDCMYIIKEGSFRAEVQLDTCQANIWPIHYKLWEMKETKTNQCFTSVIFKKNKIFGTSNILQNKPFVCDIVCNSKRATVYCLEIQHIQEFLLKDEFRQIKDVKYPCIKKAQKELIFIKKSSKHHKRIIQEAIQASSVQHNIEAKKNYSKHVQPWVDSLDLRNHCRMMSQIRKEKEQEYLEHLKYTNPRRCKTRTTFRRNILDKAQYIKNAED
ncbi:unnamed protein product [Moneuplotes crassus]|uniref:Cyclic nucleotide-binding domain-containing protein n=1 Tax=Euplotes crassus TaxID=5936 RepID=A0AAD1U572_EUPCR|nr:unnamed protein product [Moneuplotes crassus]